MVTEPVRAVCGGPPIHTDHQVAVQENLADGRHADVAQIQWINSLQFHPLLEPTAFRVHGPNLLEQVGNSITVDFPEGGMVGHVAAPL